MSISESEGLFVALTPDGDRRAVQYDASQYPRAYERGALRVQHFFQRMIHDDRVKIALAWGSSDQNIQNRSSEDMEVIDTAIINFIDHVRSNIDGIYKDTQWIHVGNPDFLCEQLRERIEELADLTREKGKKICGLCLGYGSDDETDRAISLATSQIQDPLHFREFLDVPYRAHIPYQKLDLILRTGLQSSDEPYTSGCLLPYQGSMTRARHFSDLMPHIRTRKFSDAVDAHVQRLRHGLIKNGA